LTFHTPLFKAGRYKSWHLADAALLMALKPNTILMPHLPGASFYSGRL
jgi:erythronate-4-phosphate dehydrogenase